MSGCRDCNKRNLTTTQKGEDCTAHAIGKAASAVACKQFGNNFRLEMDDEGRKGIIDIIVIKIKKIKEKQGLSTDPKHKDFATACTELNRMTFKMKDSCTKIKYDVKLTVYVVKHIPSIFPRDTAYVLAYAEHDWNGESHALYVKKKEGNHYVCANSYGKKEDQKIPEKDVLKRGKYAVQVSLKPC
jgi:hypothetical protein